jgi:hypothetical protein
MKTPQQNLLDNWLPMVFPAEFHDLPPTMQTKIAQQRRADTVGEPEPGDPRYFWAKR